MKVGSYGTVNKRMDACKDKADTEGVTLFGLDNKRCWTGTDGENTYDKFGSSAQCKEVDGNKMGYFTSESIAIYKKNNGVWELLGCYSNKSPDNALRAMSSVSVSGPDAIYDFCKEKAESSGYKLFGVDEKNCWSGDENTYNKYGGSDQCDFSKGGTGHASGQDMYGSVFVYKLE